MRGDGHESLDSEHVQAAPTEDGRYRLAFSDCYDNAFAERKGWRPPIARLAVAVYWWLRGVPASKIDEFDDRSSIWDVMSLRERRMTMWVLALAGIVLFAALVVIGLSRP